MGNQVDEVMQVQRRVGTNTGHGHVWERPDGLKARCGGPGFCQVCSGDQAYLKHLDETGGIVEPVSVSPRSLAEVRAEMARWLQDPDIRLGYVANVAMLLHDRYGITDHAARNAAAEDVLQLIFGKPEPESETKITLSGQPPAEGLEDAPAPQPIDPATGQHGDHWVLSEEDRAKGFHRPLRREYRHKPCGVTTRMSVQIAQSYAANPKFYTETFCVGCGGYRPVSEFIWPDGSEVGS